MIMEYTSKSPDSVLPGDIILPSGTHALAGIRCEVMDVLRPKPSKYRFLIQPVGIGYETDMVINSGERVTVLVP